MEGVETFVFTDNSSFEGTFFKGHSTSKKLTGIILRLRQMQQRTGSVIHVIHIAGTRMKECGIDGLSRGDLLEGMMKTGSDPLVFLPLSQSANERVHGLVADWVNTWWRSGNGDSWCGEDLTLLTPEDWFDLRNVTGPRLRIPPPAAMGAVVEMFGDDRLVRPHLPHVFVVPRLMTYLWQKQLSKDADVVLTIPTGLSFWPKEMHEPLILMIVMPLTHIDLHRGPWLVKSTDAPAALEERIKSGFVAWASPVMIQENYMSWRGLSRACGDPKRSGSGLFCTNFLLSRGSFPPCMNVIGAGIVTKKAQQTPSHVKVCQKKRMVSS
jgi:hypothetical protein